MLARGILGSGRTRGVSFRPSPNSSSWWWLISSVFLIRISCHKTAHGNGYYGAWPGWAVSISVLPLTLSWRFVIVDGGFDHQTDVTSVETSYFMPLDLFPDWMLQKEVTMHYRPPTLKGGVGEADGPSPWGQSIYINYLGFFCAKDFVSFPHLFMSVWTHGYLFYTLSFNPIIHDLFYCLSSSSFSHLGFCFSFSWIVCLLIVEFEEFFV